MMTTCHECHAAISDKAISCPRCGCPRPATERACPECANPIAASAVTCPHCGFPLTAALDPNAEIHPGHSASLATRPSRRPQPPKLDPNITLITCPKCKAQVSDKATSCPRCCIALAVPDPVANPASATSSNPATAQPDHLIYVSWTLVGLQWISFLAAPTPRGPTAQGQMITTFLISHLVVIILRTILVTIDRNSIDRRMPGKAPGLAGTILLPVVIYLDKRRRCLGRGLGLVLVELVAMWILPVVLVLASMK